MIVSTQREVVSHVGVADGQGLLLSCVCSLTEFLQGISTGHLTEDLDVPENSEADQGYQSNGNDEGVIFWKHEAFYHTAEDESGRTPHHRLSAIRYRAA